MIKNSGASAGNKGQKPVPNNIDAEKSVLSAMCLSLDAAATASQALVADSFYKLEHREIFTALISLYQNSAVGDLVLLKEELVKNNKLESAGGIEYLTDIKSYVSTTAYLEYHINIVSEKALLRKLIDSTTSVLENCFDPATEVTSLIDDAEKKIFEIAQKKQTNEFVPVKDLIGNSIDKAEQLLNLKNDLTGTPSGFADLDDKTMGFQKSDMIVLAARPSMGKTALALNIAENMAVQHNRGVGIFSLEMSKDQLVFRLLCANAGVSMQKLRSGYISASGGTDLSMAAGRLANAPIYIDDTPGISLMDLRGKARRLKARADISMIIIDYLQLLTAGGSGARQDGRQQEISDISRSIKALARELDIPIMILSQLNRAVEQRADHKPMLSDLRESGAIEQDADVVLLLYRKSYYDKDDCPGTANLILAKQRNGPTGEVALQWNSEYTKFGNLTNKQENEFTGE